MAKLNPLTKSDLNEFFARLQVTIENAERYQELTGALGKFLSRPVVSGHQAADAKPKARKIRRRRRADPALENKIVAVVKSSKGGLSSTEIAAKTSTPKERVKAIAQKLKGKGIFKVTGKRQFAKYVSAEA